MMIESVPPGYRGNLNRENRRLQSDVFLALQLPQAMALQR